MLSVLALGFCWAGFFAQLRLSETLPEDWEQRDIEVQGGGGQFAATIRKRYSLCV